MAKSEEMSGGKTRAFDLLRGGLAPDRTCYVLYNYI